MSVNRKDLVARATSRAQGLVDAGLSFSGRETTDHERHIIAAGINLGVLAAVHEYDADESTGCRCSTRPIWVADPARPNEWLHKINELGEWLRAHGFDPTEVYGAAVVDGDGGKELHLAVYDNCPEHGRYTDWATMQPAMHQRVAPLLVDPPDLGKPEHSHG
jgi:hypothetical protein